MPMPMPSPGSHGGFSPVDDDVSPTPIVVPLLPVEPIVSDTAPVEVPLVVPVPVSVADGSAVVPVDGPPVTVGSVVVVIPTESDAEPVPLVVGTSPEPVIVADVSVTLPTDAPVDPWVPDALASVPPAESPQPASPSETTHPTNPVNTRRFIRPS